MKDQVTVVHFDLVESVSLPNTFYLIRWSGGTPNRILSQITTNSPKEGIKTVKKFCWEGRCNARLDVIYTKRHKSPVTLRFGPEDFQMQMQLQEAA